MIYLFILSNVLYEIDGKILPQPKDWANILTTSAGEDDGADEDDENYQEMAEIESERDNIEPELKLYYNNLVNLGKDYQRNMHVYKQYKDFKTKMFCMPYVI